MHSHDHKNQSSARIGLVFFLNVTFTIIELIGGILFNSTAILADAVHDLGDSISIGFAWIMSKLSEKNANENYTYGYHRFTLMGALINSLVLIAGSVWVLSSAIPKLANPEMPVVEGMFGLAIFGVIVNGFAAFKLSQGTTLNEKVLNWHLLEDVLGWVAVLIVSITLFFFDWPILDPALSIVFTLFILFNVSKNLRATVKLFLQAVPDKELLARLDQVLNEFDEITNVHHMHLWSLDGEHHVLTAHLVLQQNFAISQQFDLKKRIAEKMVTFELTHTTFEFEFADEKCRDHQY